MLIRRKRQVKDFFRVEIRELYPGRPITQGQKIRLQKVLEAEAARIYEEMKLTSTAQGDGGKIYQLEKRVKKLGYVNTIIGVLLVFTLIFNFFLR